MELTQEPEIVTWPEMNYVLWKKPAHSKPAHLKPGNNYIN